MPLPERIVPVGAVHEILGIPRSKPKVAPRVHGVNILRMNITDGPMKGVWLDRDAVLRWMTNSAAATGSDVVERMVAELREVTS